MKYVIMILALISLDAKASSVQTYSAAYDKLWDAAVTALEDKTIDQANKDIGQITLKPEESSFLSVNMSKTTVVKISHSGKVTVTSDVKKCRQALGRTDCLNDADESQEKSILEAIEKALGAK